MTRIRNTFTVSFLASELGARQAISSTSGWVRTGGIPRHRADEVEIALAEAINNVVEHAYAGKDPGIIRIECKLKTDHLDISICDTGTPLPHNQLPQGLAADVSVAQADMPEGGFGWYLIRELTSKIHYERRSKENHLLLRFAFLPR